jgi:hypothetical protein
MLMRSLIPSTPGHPHFLWNPYWTPKKNYCGLHNTDPFIYNGFYYTDCKQGQIPALEGLRHLDNGSIIIFGSAKHNRWILDTVLVVREWIDHDRHTYRQQLAGRVPASFWDVTLEPTYSVPDKTWRRLYIGATYDNPIWDMYSFYPCLPATGNEGFPRPSIELASDFFTRQLRQGARGHSLASPSLPIGTLQSLWTSIRDQVMVQGLQIGVAAASPKKAATSTPDPFYGD